LSGKRRLTHKYVGPFEISEWIEAVSYRLELPQSLDSMHDILQTSMLGKHLRDEEQQQVSDSSDLDLQPDISTVEAPVRIFGPGKVSSSGAGSFPCTLKQTRHKGDVLGAKGGHAQGLYRASSRRRFRVT
jgi:hypothetical protein